MYISIVKYTYVTAVIVNIMVFSPFMGNILSYVNNIFDIIDYHTLRIIVGELYEYLIVSNFCYYNYTVSSST